MKILIFCLFWVHGHAFRRLGTGLFESARLHAIGRLSMSLSSVADKVQLYNSLTRQKEPFRAIAAPKVSFYSCGPTVYDFAHIGNFRAFLTYDVLKRWLLYCGYEVDHVCNLTDIDDKIIVKMKQENKTMKEVTNKYADAFFEDLEVLNIIKAKDYPRATQYVKEIEKMIQVLEQKGFAYSKAGSVYYRVNAFDKYGELANLDFSDVKEGAGGFGPNDRRGTDDKESARDFVLWKAYTEQDGEVRYESSFGPGRPGWHIECSAMINKILGPTIDIHAGGVDLVFPHHQNEIAQSEAYTGQEFCKYWVHNGFVNINNEKMSKSLKNFKTLRQLADKPEDARAFRYMVVTAQYRSPLNFMPDSLTSARQSLKRLDKFSMKIKAIADSGEVITSVETDAYVQEATEKCIEDFEAAMCDDMNTPRAIAALFSLVSKGEKLMKGTVPELAPLSSTNAAHVAETVRKLDSVLGVFYDVPTAYFSTAAAVEPIDEPLDFDSLEPNVQELLAARVRAKVDKDWASADKTRDDLLELGLRVKDTKDSGRGFEVFRV